MHARVTSCPVPAVRFGLDVSQCCNKSSFALMQGIAVKLRGNSHGAGKVPAGLVAQGAGPWVRRTPESTKC
jgi:hypothetical protein